MEPASVKTLPARAVRATSFWATSFGARWAGWALCFSALCGVPSWVALVALAAPAPAAAQLSPLFKDADLPLGQKLIAEHQCAACHARKVGGDGAAIYRPLGKINTPGLLRGMVDYCSTELNLGLFPEDVTAVAAVLERDHYRFAKRR